MVIYFSGTGNTEYVAKMIAEELDDECLDLFDRIRSNDKSPLYSDKTYIICAPIYVCQMPLFMTKYLKSISFNGNKKVYFVFTSGGYSGSAKHQAKVLSLKMHLKCMGYVDFLMPSNYVANQKYYKYDEKEIRTRISNVPKHVKEVAQAMKNEEYLDTRHVWLFETMLIAPFAPVWTKFKLVAKDFYATDACIGCKICEKACPLNNIKMANKKPEWGGSCTHCMACIAKCPKKAIEYGNITQGKKRYLLRDYVQVKKVK